MKAERTNTVWNLSLAIFLILTICGCQGGLTGFPSLNNLNKPTRVPPPATGSFQVPANYTDPSGGGAAATRPSTTTLGQLRSIETGKSFGDKIESDGLIASEVINGSFPVPEAISKGIVSQGLSPTVIQATALQELPDPRHNEASHGSLSSDEGVKWTSPQR